MENRVGFRFVPTDEEIIEHYIRLKNIGGSTNSHVDEAISTVDICNFDPWELPCKCQRLPELASHGGNREIRFGISSVGRITGERDRAGKPILVSGRKPSGSKTKSDWVMHEYIATFLPPPTTVQMTTYTVCKVMFKGEPTDLPSSSGGGGGGEVEHNHFLITHVNNSGGSEGLQNPRHFTGLLDAEEETQIDDALRRAIDTVSTDDLNCLLNSNENDEKQRNIMFMQENRNDYRPKMSLTGVFTGHSDDDSDSDFISTTTGSIQTSSACSSFGSSNRRIDQITDLQKSPNSTTKLMSPTQVVSKTLETSLDTSDEKNNHYEDVQGTEMGEYEIDQEVINNKRAGFFYRKIQSCIKKTLLCSSIPQEYDN
ncbi:hypothetical protein Bca4012_056624 [Brassica carinata]